MRPPPSLRARPRRTARGGASDESRSGKGSVGTKTGSPGAKRGWSTSAALTAYGVSGCTRVAARNSARASSAPAERRVDDAAVEPHGREPGRQRREPVERPRPRRERGPDPSFRRAVAGEEASRLGQLAGAVEPSRPPERLRLRIGPHAEVEEERGRLDDLARRLVPGDEDETERRRDGRGRDGGDDQPHAGARAQLAESDKAVIATLSKGMASYRELLQQGGGSVPIIGVEEARGLLDGETVFLDVREPNEWALGHVPGALLLPRAQVAGKMQQEIADKSRRVVVYCARGNRSAVAGAELRALGYERVENLIDGFIGWEERGLPTVVPSTLPEDQRRRYSRHMLIPEVGEEGQRRLLEARVLLIGAGGLGSPASLYLAAAGVGTLGIVDDDVVDESNLQRQIAHSTHRVGVPKVESARETLQALNPDVEVAMFQERLSSENVDRILAEGWDLIVDGADNFPTRYLVNDASVWHGIPVVHGSIYRFEGQITVFRPGDGPCYRCLFPAPPPPELAPSCAEGGVLGVLPGVIGSLQANEALKLVLGIGDPLVGRLLLFDALSATFTEVALRRDPGCPVCGEEPTITEYIDYVEFCAAR